MSDCPYYDSLLSISEYVWIREDIADVCARFGQCMKICDTKTRNLMSELLYVLTIHHKKLSDGVYDETPYNPNLILLQNTNDEYCMVYDLEKNFPLTLQKVLNVYMLACIKQINPQ